MPSNFAGRVGQTLIGEHAPVASTSGTGASLHQVRYLMPRKHKRYWICTAQLQQEGGKKDLKNRSETRRTLEESEHHEQPSTSEQTISKAAESLQASRAPRSNWLQEKWESTPAQYKLVFACAWAFVICNMDKVNISVAIISMSRDFNWSPTTSGIVQSSFFAGYMISQIPGGYLVSKLGGRKVLPAGVALWSAATAATPLLAGSLPGIFLCRILVGLGEGVAPTSATDMVARVCKQSERSRAIGFMFSGLHVGSLAGLLVAPILIERLGWPAVFYMFGGAGLVWSWWWESLMAGIRKDDPEVTRKLSSDRGATDASAAASKQDVPWRAMLRNTPVRALAYVHFCNNWAAYTMTAWLPSYFSDSLSLDLTQASQAAIFPPMAAIVASSIAGPVADYVVSRGAPVGRVRKTAQAVAFLGPATFLSLACKLAGGGADNEMLTVGLVSAALGLASVSVAGLYSNHADLSNRHASLLLGLTNTMGAIPGIVGVTLTGIIFDKTRDWNLALFAPSIFFYMTGTVVFAIFGSAEPQSFDSNSPFGLEKYFQPVVQRAAKLPLASTSTSLLSKARSLTDKVKRKL